MSNDGLNIELVVWKRRTFHECAIELSSVSREFREAYLDLSLDSKERELIMGRSSTRGNEILKVLALAIRNDQDAGLTNFDGTTVGGLLDDVDSQAVSSLLNAYKPPWNQQAGFKPIDIRNALNKIAHADPYDSGFYADEDHHDLLLTGKYQGKKWITIVSVPKLCDVIMTLPDVQTGNDR